MPDGSVQKWLRISLFNLAVVACAGVVLRYKIAFSLPWVDQKYLLHGHSHFAFAGWISQALMALLVQYLEEKGQPGSFRKYRWLLYANLATAYGMLISFILQGYALFSIIFSTLSIFVSYAFAVLYAKDLKRLPIRNGTETWFGAALLFNVISSLGAFSLAFMLATKHSNEHAYLASIYAFLHFQYNGWFFFGCAGLLHDRLVAAGLPGDRLKIVFRSFVVACIPAYLLSTLWLPLPGWLYWIVVAAALLQLYGWTMLLLVVCRNIRPVMENLPAFSRTIFLLVAIALTIKLSLQALSVIPALSTLAFGFRPIVIGYLHLVLLGVISLFLLGFVFARGYLRVNKTILAGLFVFVTGVLLNEIILMTQGAGGIAYVVIPHADLLLLAAAAVLFAGVTTMNAGLYGHAGRESQQ